MKKPLTVGDKYRTNPLSHKKTDLVIIVEYTDGKLMRYINIHNPIAYMNAMDKSNVVDAWVESTKEKINYKK